ncbi:MAG: hypothetical protein K5985_07875 [Lachnospiraceae bacterium]|nr:hypothetical protein [Lachnospiraceae bacterium]
MDSFELMHNAPEKQKLSKEEPELTMTQSVFDMEPVYANEVLSEKEIEDSRKEQIEKNKFLYEHQIIDLTGEKLEEDLKPKETTSLLGKMVASKIRVFNKSFSDKVLKDNLNLFKLRTAEKDANYSNHELYLSMADLKVIHEKFGVDEKIDGSVAIDAILRLYTASDAYMKSHGGISIFPNAKARKKAAKDCLDMSKQFFNNLITADDEAKIQSSGKYALEISGKSLSNLAKRMKDAARALKRFENFRSDSGAVMSPEQIIEAKLASLKQYDEVIRLYRFHFKPKEWTSAARECIEEYENLLRMELVIKYNRELKAEKAKKAAEEAEKSGKKAEETKQKTFNQLMEEHLEIEDKKKDKKKLDPSRVDRGLNEAQLKGIGEIDKWLIENAENGGLAGLLPFINFKNDNANFVNALLAKSRRERLYIYYMVESNHRKNPTFTDVAISQNDYIPTLEGFKDRMLATKLKAYKYFTGGYTYMHKLTQANLLSEKNKDLIEHTANLQNNIVTEKPANENLTPLEELRQDRLKAFEMIYVELNGYRSQLQKAQAARGADKKTAEAAARENAVKMQAKIKELLDKDLEIRIRAEAYLKSQDKEQKKDIVNRNFSKKNDLKEQTEYAKLLLGTAPSKVILGAHVNKEKVFTSWTFGLDEKSWQNLNLWSGSVAGALAVVSSAMTIISSAINLVSRHSEMNMSEMVQNTLEIAKGGLDIATMGSNIADLASKGGEYGSIASNATKTLGALSAGVDIFLARTKLSNARKSEKSYDTVKKLFDEKHAGINEADQKTKYEKGMLKLSKDLINRKYASGRYNALTGYSTFLSLVIPGVGATIMVGVAGVGGLVSTIHDIRRMGKIREGMFDAYYNVDELTRKALEVKKQNCLDPDLYVEPDVEMFRPSVRQAICAAAGLSDLESAADHIAAEYANFVCDKLFGEDPVQGDERKQYIEVVKMFDLPYDEEKKIPSRAALCEKMKGA